MLNHSSVGAVGLAVVAGMLSGCSPWSWLDVRMIRNTEGLGTGPIADLIRERSMVRSGDGLKAEIERFIVAQTSAKGLSRTDAESLGMQCMLAPRTECAYSDELWNRTDGIPPNSPFYRKGLSRTYKSGCRT